MGKVIVILVMFMGRIGPVTLAVALRRRTGRKDVDIQRPEQRILIG
jgi:trk system potassium uptake protein TrkH